MDLGSALQMKTNKPYATLAQASKAAVSLGITSSREYRKTFKADPRLPYTPDKSYPKEWSGWPAFLKTNRKKQLDIPDCFYATYSQARSAITALGIKSKQEYKLKHRLDDKLPPTPEAMYGGYWRDWGTFINGPIFYRSDDLYKTLSEASVAAKKLGAKTARDYISVYCKDPRLPSNPSTFYKEWKGWNLFLGTKPVNVHFYKSLKSASTAAKELKILSARDYVQRYKSDPRLPSNPSQVYDNWSSWDQFLGK